jgi:S-formylglutathione hydrolase FrmB
LLLAGIGAAGLAVACGAGVAADVLPGRPRLYGLLGLDGPDGHVPDVEPGPSVSGTFRSAARRGIDVGYTIAYPPGRRVGDRLPVMVVLHGRGGDHLSAFGEVLGLDRFLAVAVATPPASAAPFAIASVDGGDTYWHARADGENSGAMVVDEFLPLLRAHGLTETRVALFGWSMGGYGALLLADQLGATRTAAVIAASPALWLRASDTAPGAFDNAADYAAHDVFGQRAQLTGIPIRIDCGTGDGFYRAAKVYAQGLQPHPAGGFEAGGHTLGYWRRMAPAQLQFVAAQFVTSATPI